MNNSPCTRVIILISWVITSKCEAIPSAQPSTSSIVSLDYLSGLTSSVFSFLGQDESPSSAREDGLPLPFPKDQEKASSTQQGLSLGFDSKNEDLGREGKKILHSGKLSHPNGGFKADKRKLKESAILNSKENLNLRGNQNGVSDDPIFSKEMEEFVISDVVGETFLNKLDMAIWKHGIQNETQFKVLEKLLGDVGPKHDYSNDPHGVISSRPAISPNRMANKKLSSVVEEDTSKLTVDNVVTDKSSEVRDLALKKWLKPPKGDQKHEGENTIEELSYKILSLVDHEKNTKAEEENDKQIYTAVLASMAAFQIRKLQRQLRHGRVKRDEERVCYRDLGCFTDEGAFDYFDYLPDPPEEIGTKFILYTRKNIDKEQLITMSNSSIASSNFDPNKPTKMVVHGFGSSCDRPWVRSISRALLTMMDVNIVCVDWENGATVPNYMRAASNTRLVGRQVSQMIKFLTSSTNSTLDSFHLIGFSLGAHVSGHAGKALKLKRISGLDPAGPLFENSPASVRLDRSDAEYVDVIHTNAESLLWGGLGAYQPMGHVDFYPNGGRMQKGCANLFVGGVSDILWPTEGDGRSLCNHRRGYKYFVESIAPVCKFPSFVCSSYETFLTGDCFPCKSCGNMGYYSDQAEGRGQLYLVTRDSEPFCANQYKVSLRHSGGPPLLSAVSTYGRVDVTFIGGDGINETIPLTRMPDEELKAGATTNRILVPHPAITGIKSLQLLYTAYDGWVYSGSRRWAIDKISIMDSYGNKQSFCRLGVTLETGVPMVLKLSPGDCTPQFRPWRNKKPYVDVPKIHGNATDESTLIEETTFTTKSSNKTSTKTNSISENSAPAADRNQFKFVPENHETGDISTNFAVIRPDDNSNSSHSSVVIRFPKPSTGLTDTKTGLTSTGLTDTKKASSSFSISLPSPASRPPSEYPSYSIQNSGNFQKFGSPYRISSYDYTSLYPDYSEPLELRSNATKATGVLQLEKPSLRTESNDSGIDPVYINPFNANSDQNLNIKPPYYNQGGSKQDVSFIKEGPAPNLYPEDEESNIQDKIELVATSEEPVKILEPPKIVSEQVHVAHDRNHHEVGHGYVNDGTKLWVPTVQYSPYPHRFNYPNAGHPGDHNNSSNSVVNRTDKPEPVHSQSSQESSSSSSYTDSLHFEYSPDEFYPIIDPLSYHIPILEDKHEDAEEIDRFSYLVHNDKGEQGLLILGSPESSSAAAPPEGSQSLQTFFGTEKLALDGLENIPQNIKIIPYNSLIDGEIPINEMAKALFGKASDKNQIIYVKGNDFKSSNVGKVDENSSPFEENINSGPLESSYHSYDIPPPANYPSSDFPPSFMVKKQNFAQSTQVEHTSESIVPRVSLLTNSYVQLSRHIPSTKQIDSNPPIASSPQLLPEFLRPPSLVSPSYLRIFDLGQDTKRPDSVGSSSIPKDSPHLKEEETLAPSTDDEDGGSSIFPKILTDIAEQFSAIAGYPDDETEKSKIDDENKSLTNSVNKEELVTKIPRDKGQKLRPSMSEDIKNQTAFVVSVSPTSEAPSIFSWRYYFGDSTEIESYGNSFPKKDSVDITMNENVQPSHLKGDAIVIEEEKPSATNIPSPNQESFSEIKTKSPSESNHQPQSGASLLQHSIEDRKFIADPSLTSRKEKSLDVNPSSPVLSRLPPTQDNSGYERIKLPRIRPHHSKRLMRLPDTRRQSKSIYRFLPRILTPSLGHRRVPSAPSHVAASKHFAPNYPFLQLDPFTALPTKLIAPPPPPRPYNRNSVSASNKRQNSKIDDESSNKASNVLTASTPTEQIAKTLDGRTVRQSQRSEKNIGISHHLSSELNVEEDDGSKRIFQVQDAPSGRSLRHKPAIENDFLKDSKVSSLEHTLVNERTPPFDEFSNTEKGLTKMSQPILDIFYPKSHFTSNADAVPVTDPQHHSQLDSKASSDKVFEHEVLSQLSGDSNLDQKKENFNKRSGEIKTLGHEFLLEKEISRLPDPIHSSHPSYEFSPYFPYPRVKPPSRKSAERVQQDDKQISPTPTYSITFERKEIPQSSVYSTGSSPPLQPPPNSRHFLSLLEPAISSSLTNTAEVNLPTELHLPNRQDNSASDLENSRINLQDPNSSLISKRKPRYSRHQQPILQDSHNRPFLRFHSSHKGTESDRLEKSFPTLNRSSKERIAQQPQSSLVVPQSSHVVPQSSHVVPQSSHVVPQSSHVVPQSSYVVPSASGRGVLYVPIVLSKNFEPVTH